jgi:hypothetical protein
VSSCSIYRWTWGLTVAVVALTAVGCSSTEDGEGELTRDPNSLYTPPPRPSREVEFDFEHEWNEIERLDGSGDKDPVEVAQWVRERVKAAEDCLKAVPGQPPAVVQAIELLEEVRIRVPDSSYPRYLLATCYFQDAAYWFRAADLTAYAMDYLLIENRLPITDSEGGVNEGAPLSDEDKQRLTTEFQTYLARANSQVKVVARNSLNEFMVYRQTRPDDRRVIAYVWKLHFMLQEYEESLRWLDYAIHLLDVNEVPQTDPLRRQWAQISDVIRDYLTSLRIQGTTPPPQGVMDTLTNGAQLTSPRDFR